MNEDDMTLDQIIAFHTLMCEAQKIIDSWDAEDDADQLGDDFDVDEDAYRKSIERACKKYDSMSNTDKESYIK